MHLIAPSCDRRRTSHYRMMVTFHSFSFLVEPVSCGHPRDDRAKDPSFIKQITSPMEVDSRIRGRHIVGTAKAGCNTTVERTGQVWITSLKKYVSEW